MMVEELKCLKIHLIKWADLCIESIKLDKHWVKKMSKKILEDFRDLKISKAQLESLIENKSLSLVIERKDLAFVLKQYAEGKIDQTKLLYWVNVIWVTDLFEYKESDAECLTNIMHALEELDEREYSLDENEAQYYIDALDQNKVIPFYPNIKSK